jgi:signal transduction histidine kinase
MIYNGRECRLLLIRDVSQVKENAKLNAEFKMLSLMASSVSHEMLTPMRCIINLTKGIEKRLTDYIKKDPQVGKELDLVDKTAMLLLN